MRTLVAMLYLLSALGWAQEVKVAVAANLQATFEQLIKQFGQANPGIKVSASYGSSGTFAQQIAQGAPFDLFMSADLAFPQQLQKQGLIEEGTLKVYAVGKLILFIPSRVGIRATGLENLNTDKVSRLIIANPETAPYGKAAVQTMTKTGLYEKLRGKIAQAQNIAQAAQLTLAAGDAGFINLSAIYGPDLKQQGTWYIVPQKLYDPLEQAYAVIKGHARPEVKTLYAFLSSAEANKTYKAWGYDLPR